jgi:hypothetical protein
METLCHTLRSSPTAASHVIACQRFAAETSRMHQALDGAIRTNVSEFVSLAQPSSGMTTS